ncbi:CHAT domain-containing protein [Streptomyces sp. NBC_00828]|uniref:CHAT domain-containing protein n=1 Tax=Streptomyces sp. NBC_00828 TaxID=2903678 RepID=UPI0038663328
MTDRMLRELLSGEQRAGGETERNALRMARGTLLAVRYLADGPADGADRAAGGGPGGPSRDRAEALALLREARTVVPVTEKGARSREAVTLLLLRLLMPSFPKLQLQGRQDFIEMVKVGAAFMTPGGSAMREDLAEAGALLEELSETADPAHRPDLEGWTAHLRMLGAMNTDDPDALLELGASVNASGTMPPQLSMVMGAAMELLKAMPGTQAEPAGTNPEPGGENPEMPAVGIPDQVERFADELLPVLELISPGILEPAEFEQATDALPRDSWQEQMTVGLVRLGMAMREGDPERLVEAAEPLLQAFRNQDAPAGVSPILLAGLLSGAHMSGGNLKDAAAAQRLLAESFGSGDVVRDMPPGPFGKELADSGRALLLHQLIGEVPEDDLDAFDDIAEVLLDMRQELTEEDSSASLVLFNLGTLQLRRAMAIGRAGGTVGPPLRRALMYLREAREHPGTPVALRGVIAATGTMTSALEQYVDPSSRGVLAEVERARASLGGPVVFADQDIRVRMGMALALRVEHERHGDPAVLETALRELNTARAAIDDRTACGTAQEVYRELAGLYRSRAAAGDTDRALEATERQLEKIAEDVLLQIGAEHGLSAARAAADRGVTAAAWAAEADDAAAALRVLEAGRALVLRAIAASATVPEQLAAQGAHELAAQWRDVARTGTEADTTGTAALRTDAATEARTGTATETGTGTVDSAPEARTDSVPGVSDDADTLIPSTLRRRALGALRAGAGISGAPAWQEIADAAQSAGVDAVVHLLVGPGDEPGWALVVRPGMVPLPLELTGLGAAGRAPLERYLDAARDRSLATDPSVPRSAPGRTEAVEAWRTALEELCDWAGPAVMGPVLEVVRPGRPARTEAPVRLVLLPAGNLGSVPWHAARLAATAGERTAYAVDHAVISYAASGAEFLRSAARARLPVASDPVLVADPRCTLPNAEHEIEGLRQTYYGHARCYGYFSRNVFHIDGTPDELLPLLPGGGAERPATLVQFSVHGFAGGRPTVSGLLLHPPRQEGGSEDAPGVLTVRRLLGAPVVAGDPADGGSAAGPLVVLSACETDLSTRDHDETLTLTTAFVARGAADVIGSKWAVSDASSAVLMNVLHHFLAQGADPAQALRRTQLWALDPDRPAVPGLIGPLTARIKGKPALSLDVWAPFIHQGNPAPLRPEGNIVGHE